MTKDLEGNLAVEQTDHMVREGAAGLGAVGFAVGLFAPPLLAATAIGAAVGAVAGKALHKKTGSKIEEMAGATIPIGGAGLIVAYPHSAAEKVEPAVTRAIQKAVGEAEGHHVQALKGALADAQQKMAEGSMNATRRFSSSTSRSPSRRRTPPTRWPTRCAARGCDVTMAPLEFTDPHYGPRFRTLPMKWPIAKIVGMLPAQARRKTGDIRIPPEASAGDYDLVVLGAPTWWLTTCMPMRSYLHDPALRARRRRQAVRGVLDVSPVLQAQHQDDARARREGRGPLVDETHFVADGNQVMSMWSWLVFMRHNVEKRRRSASRCRSRTCKADYEQQAVDVHRRRRGPRAGIAPAANAG